MPSGGGPRPGWVQEEWVAYDQARERHLRRQEHIERMEKSDCEWLDDVHRRTEQRCRYRLQREQQNQEIQQLQETELDVPPTVLGRGGDGGAPERARLTPGTGRRRDMDVWATQPAWQHELDLQIDSELEMEREARDRKSP